MGFFKILFKKFFTKTSTAKEKRECLKEKEHLRILQKK